MAYGVEVKKLETVHLGNGIEIAVLPEIMKELGLQAGQEVDAELAQKIVAENDRLTRAK